MADTKAAKKTYHLGTGRRKTAVARIRMSEGTGKVSVNGKAVEDYFTEEKDRNAVYGPLEVTDLRSRVDVTVTVSGGGYSGQAGAVCQGVARAIKEMFGLTTPAAGASADGQPAEGDGGATAMSKVLRDSGYLTRDGRMKERKKYGRKGARKSFQFSKR